MTTSTRRGDLAAAIAGIVLGGLAGAGVVSANGGGGEVVACVQGVTGAVSAEADCGPAGSPEDRESAAR
jgi:hypothetical protein